MRNLVVALALSMWAVPALAGGGSFHFTKPSNTTDTTVKVEELDHQGNVKSSAEITIPPGTSATKKRDLIREKLKEKGFDVADDDAANGDPGVKITGITAGRKLVFRPGSTGEKADSVTIKKAEKTSLALSGSFSSTDWAGRPATFTLGVSTARGSAVVTYLADDVPRHTQLAGTTIADRLYRMLTQTAADLGAMLYLEESQIEILFDGGVNEPEASMTFGTTSPGSGLAASAEIPATDEDIELE